MFFKETEQLNGKKLSYIRTSDWKEDIILFFHGFCGSKGYFPDLEFEGDPCIVSFDRPGVGESSVDEYHTMESFLTNAHDILKKHKVSTVRVIGHSAGGYYAQVFAEMYPEIVKSLSLLSSMIPLNCPKTKELVKGNWSSIVNLSLKHKRFSRFYFKKMAKGINKKYEKQLAANMKTLFPQEKEFMEKNHDMVKDVVIAAVANDGAGVCHDAYALCLERAEVKIPKGIQVYVWQGTKDTTVPPSFTDYFKNEYAVKEIHMIENIGHMLYLPYWEEIVNEARSNT